MLCDISDVRGVCETIIATERTAQPAAIAAQIKCQVLTIPPSLIETMRLVIVDDAQLES